MLGAKSSSRTTLVRCEMHKFRSRPGLLEVGRGVERTLKSFGFDIAEKLAGPTGLRPKATRLADFPELNSVLLCFPEFNSDLANALAIFPPSCYVLARAL